MVPSANGLSVNLDINIPLTNTKCANRGRAKESIISASKKHIRKKVDALCRKCYRGIKEKVRRNRKNPNMPVFTYSKLLAYCLAVKENLFENKYPAGIECSFCVRVDLRFAIQWLIIRY